MKTEKIFGYVTFVLGAGMFLGLLYFYYILENAGLMFPPLSAFGTGVIAIVITMVGLSGIVSKPKFIQEIPQTLTTTQKKKQSILFDYYSLFDSLKLNSTQKIQFTDVLSILEASHPKENPFIGQDSTFYFEKDHMVKIILSTKTEGKVKYSTLEKKFSAYNKSKKT